MSQRPMSITVSWRPQAHSQKYSDITDITDIKSTPMKPSPGGLRHILKSTPISLISPISKVLR